MNAPDHFNWRLAPDTPARASRHQHRDDADFDPCDVEGPDIEADDLDDSDLSRAEKRGRF